MLFFFVFIIVYILDDVIVFIVVFKFWEFNVEYVLQELQGVEIVLVKLELLVKELEDFGLLGSEWLCVDFDKIRLLKQDVEVLKVFFKYKVYVKELRILEFQVGDVILGCEIVVVCFYIFYENCFLVVFYVDFYFIFWVLNCVLKDFFVLI